MSRVSDARAAVLDVVRRYAPVHQAVKQDALQALNTALDDLQQAVMAEATAPAVAPALPPNAAPPQDVGKARALAARASALAARADAAARAPVDEEDEAHPQGMHRVHPQSSVVSSPPAKESDAPAPESPPAPKPAGEPAGEPVQAADPNAGKPDEELKRQAPAE